MSSKSPWSSQNAAIASKQGWNLFSIWVSRERFEIQREDESEIFDNDAEAVEFVLRHAKRSKTCRKAVGIVYGF